MTDDFQVTGAEDFLKLSKALKAAGSDLRKVLNKSLQEAVKPLIPLTREAALAELPHGGGLADVVAKAPQRVQVRTGSKTAGVRLVVGSRGRGARGANVGAIRHPVFGNRDIWVNQAVPAGWFDKTVKNNVHLVLPEVEKALQDMVEKIARGVR